jgi:hypothetical protein
MASDANEPDPGTSAAAEGAVASTPAVQQPLPGLVAGIGSIVAGVIGFGIPVLGVVGSCVGIWLGVRGFRAGRTANYRPSVVCSGIGMTASVLGLVFWVCAVLFESYR